MRVSRHVAVSGVISGLVYTASMSWQMAVAAFLTGIFIDIDHVFDYLREYGFRPDLRTFFESFTGREYDRIIILFHAWELVVVAAVLAWLSGWNQWVVGITIGAGQHLVCDQASNRLGKYAYFLLYRLHHRFLPRNMFRPDRNRQSLQTGDQHLPL